jgi:hypothetical protein
MIISCPERNVSIWDWFSNNEIKKNDFFDEESQLEIEIRKCLRRSAVFMLKLVVSLLTKMCSLCTNTANAFEGRSYNSA